MRQKQRNAACVKSGGLLAGDQRLLAVSGNAMRPPQDSIVARYDIRRAGLRRVRSAAAACASWRGAPHGVLLAAVPSACLPPTGRAGVGDDRGPAPPPGAHGGLSGWRAGSVPGGSRVPGGVRAGAPPSPRALPSFQPGCSRQRESSSVKRGAGLPMLLREVGSSRDIRARPARVLRPPRPGRRRQWSGRGVHAACCSGARPAAMAGSQATCRVTTTWIQRSSAAAQAVRACWRASRLSSRVVR
jgi:hypothetical protein